MEIFRIDKSVIAPDGKHFTISFESDGEPLVLEANAFALEPVVAELAALAARAREIRGEKSIAAVSSPAQYRVVPTKDHQHVVVGFRMENGLDHQFGFDIPNAEALQAQLRAAIDRCKSA